MSPLNIQPRLERRVDQTGHLSGAGAMAGGSCRPATAIQAAGTGPIDTPSPVMRTCTSTQPPAVCGEREGSLNAVEAVPKMYLRRETGKLVALEPSKEVPADAGRSFGRLRQQLLGVVLAKVQQACPTAASTASGPKPLVTATTLTKLGLAPALEMRSLT